MDAPTNAPTVAQAGAAEPKRRGRRGKKDEEKLVYQRPDKKFVQAASQLVDINKLRWTVSEEDLQVSGQIRCLDDALVVDRVQSLKAALPDKFIRVTVVPVDPHGVCCVWWGGCIWHNVGTGNRHV